MNTGQHLIEAIQKTGTRHVFGVPGDYILSFFGELSESPLELVGTCNEPASGFAADAYARTTGFGVACVTYGVGALSLVNTTAQAFAEWSPVLFISGSPGLYERGNDPLLHHKVKSFETQLNVFKEMTVAQACLDSPETAATEIDRVIDAVQRYKRPGYIEVPRDLMLQDVLPSRWSTPAEPEPDEEALDEAVAEIIGMMNAADRPLVGAGLLLHRFGAQQPFLDFIERTGLPFWTGINSKSVVSEDHPQFVGTYCGGYGNERVRETAAEADCLLLLGGLVTDFGTGFFTTGPDIEQTISVMPDSIRVRHHTYQGAGLRKVLEKLTAAWPREGAEWRPQHYEMPEFEPQADRKITAGRVFECINGVLDQDTTVIAEPGDAEFGSLDLHIHGETEYLCPAYYMSLGFAVPAAIGVQMADRSRQPLVIEGDGSFQMTGMELSLAVKHGLSPTVVVLNNGGYGLFRPILDGPFTNIPPWNYAELPRVIGGGLGFEVVDEEGMAAALEVGRKNTSSPTIIDVRLDRLDCSQTLTKMCELLKQRALKS